MTVVEAADEIVLYSLRAEMFLSTIDLVALTACRKALGVTTADPGLKAETRAGIDDEEDVGEEAKDVDEDVADDADDDPRGTRAFPIKLPGSVRFVKFFTMAAAVELMGTRAWEIEGGGG